MPRKKTKVYQLSTLQHHIRQFLIKSYLNFVFKSKTRSRSGFSNTSVYWTSKGCGRTYFTRKTLIDAMSFLITKCYITIGNLVFKQEIGIPMGIDPAPY